MADVYCSSKFLELQVHIQGRLLYNCCKAWPERVDLNWLEQNPGMLFHTPTMIADRNLMLEGKRSKSCDYGCYRYEDQGIVSARYRAPMEKITNPYNQCRSLTISLSNDCNLTCAYCSSEWSTAWSRDIKRNGKYQIAGYRNENDKWVDLWSVMKQKDRSTHSKFFKLLLREVELCKGIKKIIIHGGEPLLNNGLTDLLDRIKDREITIVTGLGVDDKKFFGIMDKIRDHQNISFSISAESTDSIFEFLRFGLSWDMFLKRINHIKQYGIKIKFSSTMTNIAAFGILRFYDLFSGQHEIIYNPVTDRPFLQPNVLDDFSKKILIESMKDRSDNVFFSRFIKSISQDHKDTERQNLAIFLKEFSNRRNLKLDIFPDNFLKWLDVV